MSEDTRRLATRAEIDAYLADIGKVRDFCSFPLWENSRFHSIRNAGDLHDVIGVLTGDQVTLHTFRMLENDVEQGGLEQFFFNKFDQAHFVRAGLAKLGWPDLTSRYNEAHALALEAPDMKGKVAALHKDFQSGFSIDRPQDENFAPFRRVYELLDCKAFNAWFGGERAAFRAHVAAFVRGHEAGLFEIVDG